MELTIYSYLFGSIECPLVEAINNMQEFKGKVPILQMPDGKEYVSFKDFLENRLHIWISSIYVINESAKRFRLITNETLHDTTLRQLLKDFSEVSIQTDGEVNSYTLIDFNLR